MESSPIERVVILVGGEVTKSEVPEFYEVEHYLKDVLQSEQVAFRVKRVVADVCEGDRAWQESERIWREVSCYGEPPVVTIVVAATHRGLCAPLMVRTLMHQVKIVICSVKRTYRGVSFTYRLATPRIVG